MSSKREDPSHIPQIHVKMLGMVAHTCNPSAEDVQIGRFLGLIGQPLSLMVSFSLIKEVDSVPEVPWPPHACVHKCITHGELFTQACMCTYSFF